jgi:hypothetical protein
MKTSRLAVMALATTVVLSGTAFGLRYLLPGPPAPKRPATLAAVSDPAEPPLKVEVSTGGPAKPVTAAGTTLKFDTTGASHGQANLTFKNASPPMGFTLTLAKMPSYDLESLTIASGSLSLAVGPVSASPTTRYFDARGRALKGPDGAAYTLTARRWEGEVDIEIRRASGAAMRKELTVSWKSRLVYGGGLRGG